VHSHDYFHGYGDEGMIPQFGTGGLPENRCEARDDETTIRHIYFSRRDGTLGI
jgi:hypothetical protein